MKKTVKKIVCTLSILCVLLSVLVIAPSAENDDSYSWGESMPDYLGEDYFVSAYESAHQDEIPEVVYSFLAYEFDECAVSVDVARSLLQDSTDKDLSNWDFSNDGWAVGLRIDKTIEYGKGYFYFAWKNLSTGNVMRGGWDAIISIKVKTYFRDTVSLSNPVRSGFSLDIVFDRLNSTGVKDKMDVSLFYSFDSSIGKFVLDIHECSTIVLYNTGDNTIYKSWDPTSDNPLILRFAGDFYNFCAVNAPISYPNFGVFLSHFFLPYLSYNDLVSYPYAFTLGNENGYSKGFEYGYSEGYTEGYSFGNKEGYSDGFDKGYSDGSLAGWESGKEYTVNYLTTFYDDYWSNFYKSDAYGNAVQESIHSEDSNPVTAFFNSMWNGVIHAYDTVTNGVSVGGISLGNVIITLVIAAVVIFVIKMVI